MRKVYVSDREIVRKKGVHTVYTGSGGPIGSKDHKVKTTVFLAGAYRDLETGKLKEMEGQEYNELKDLGYVSPTNPNSIDQE